MVKLDALDVAAEVAAVDPHPLLALVTVGAADTALDAEHVAVVVTAADPHRRCIEAGAHKSALLSDATVSLRDLAMAACRLGS